jgi:hypothetical protein
LPSLTRLGTASGASWRVSDIAMMAGGVRKGWCEVRSG